MSLYWLAKKLEAPDDSCFPVLSFHPSFSVSLAEGRGQVKSYLCSSNPQTLEAQQHFLA